MVLSPVFELLRPQLADEGQAVYLVGGTVRDALLGRPIHDIDLIVETGALPLTFRLAGRLGMPAYALDSDRDVGRIIVPGEEITIDIARFRGPSLVDDLRGRDFTINAMALPVWKDSLDDVIDLHDGLGDLRSGLVRIIHLQSIEEDPVRALRAARFATQLGYRLSGETAEAARAAGPALSARVSVERIRDELSRCLTGGAPREAVALLDELELLERVLPDVAALRAVNQSPPHHEAVLPHTLTLLHYMRELEQLMEGREAKEQWEVVIADAVGRHFYALREHLDQPVDGSFTGRVLIYWSGLFHDVGKAATQSTDESGRIRFFGHDEVGARIAGRRLAEFAFSNEAVRRVRDTVAGHMRPLQLAREGRAPSRRAVYRYFKALHKAGLDVGLLSVADHLATYDGPGDRESFTSLLRVVSSLFEAYFTTHEQTIAPRRLLDGREVMSLLDTPPGREIGRVMRLLEEAQASGEVTTRDEAVSFVRRHRSR